MLYAGLWEVFRTPHSLSSGGPGSGLFKSTDGGDDVDRADEEPGLPAGLWGKVGVSVSPADANRVYAIVENENGGVFVSDDGGATWKLVNDERRLRQRAFYYTRIYADPKERDTVYVLNTGFYRSTDAGKTYRSFRVPHGDNHDLWIAPNDPKRMINGNDGGANVSRQRRRDLDRPGLPDRAVLQRVRHRARAVSRVRRAAGQQHRLRVERRRPRSCTPSAAARAATSRPTRAIRTCSTPAATAGI